MEMQPGMMAPAIQAPDTDQEDPRLVSAFRPSIEDMGPAPPITHEQAPSIQAPVAQHTSGFTPDQQKINPMAGMFAKADNIHNPFLRALAKIGSGVGAVGLGFGQGATDVAKDRAEAVSKQHEEERQNAIARAQIEKSQHDKYDLKTGVNPASGEEEHFYLGPDGKPVFTGVKTVKAPGKTMDEQAMAARVKENVTKGMSPDEATLEAFKFVKQGAEDVKAPKSSIQKMDNGDVVEILTDDKGAATAKVVYKGDPKVETDIIQRTGPDGVDHNILVDKRAGTDIRDLGPRGSTTQGGGIDNALSRFNIQPGDTGQALLDKVKAVDPIAGEYLRKVVKYEADSAAAPTTLRKGTGQMSKTEIEGLAGLVDPTWRADQYKVISGLKDDYTKGKTGKNISSLLQGVHHLSIMGKDVKDASWGVPALTATKNWLSEAAGGHGGIKANMDVTAVAGELATIFKNSGATDDEIKQWKSNIKPNMNARQIDDVIESGMNLLAGRLAVQAQRYEAGAGKPYDFNLVDKGTRELLAKLPGGQGVLDVMGIHAAGAGGGFDHTKFPKAR